MTSHDSKDDVKVRRGMVNTLLNTLLYTSEKTLHLKIAPSTNWQCAIRYHSSAHPHCVFCTGIYIHMGAQQKWCLGQALLYGLEGFHQVPGHTTTPQIFFRLQFDEVIDCNHTEELDSMSIKHMTQVQHHTCQTTTIAHSGIMSFSVITRDTATRHTKQTSWYV